MQHLQCGFVCLQNVTFQKVLVQPVVERGQPLFRCVYHPISHGLAREFNPKACPLLFLAVEGQTVYVLTAHDVRHCRGRCQTPRDHRRRCFGRNHRGADIFALAAAAGVNVTYMFDYFHLSRDDLQFLAHLGAHLV